MRRGRRLRSFACAAFVIALCTSAALAQETRGSITGTVPDSTGVVVAGAAIKPVNTGTDMLFTAETNSAGQYPAYRQIDNNIYPYWQTLYYAPWLQDDMKLTKRLTINIGFGWDYTARLPIRMVRGI